MIPFTDPHPDEIFYSVVARFTDHMGLQTAAVVTQMMTRKSVPYAQFFFPVNLSALEAMLPPGTQYTADSLIAGHTQLPYFAPFLEPERVDRIVRAMKVTEKASAHSMLGTTHLKPRVNFIRYCPQCAHEDRQMYGETYWHRSHNLPGIQVCGRHGVWLEESSINTEKSQSYVPAERVVPDIEPRYVSSEDPMDDVRLFLAQNASYLLNHVIQSHPDDNRKRILNALLDAGYATYRQDQVQSDRLVADIKACYTGDFLESINCALENTGPMNWVLRCIRSSSRMPSPQQTLLLLHFLALDAEAYFELTVERQYFGAGPWPCLNRASDHYGESRIAQHDVRFAALQGKPPIGIFTCDCGFSYERRGPDASVDDWQRYDRVVRYGAEWDAHLTHLWQAKNMSVKKMANELGVSEPTVVRQAERLGLKRGGDAADAPDGLPLPPRNKIAAKREERRRECRAALLQARRDYPEATRTFLGEHLPREMNWLRKHDKHWLENHLPPRQRPNNAVTRKPPRPRQDWTTLDQQLCPEVREAAAAIRNETGRPRQVTVSAIGKQIGQLSRLQSRLHRLPQTAEALSEVVETVEDWAIRRVHWAKAYYLTADYCPWRWELAKKAALRQTTADLPAVRAAIDAAMEELEQSHSPNDIRLVR